MEEVGQASKVIREQRVLEEEEDEGNLDSGNKTHFIKKLIPNMCLTKCNVGDGFKWAAIALIIIAFIVGTAGLLVYLNKLLIGLQHVGTMSQTAGFYTMLGGYTLAFVTGVLLILKAWIENSRAKKHITLTDTNTVAV